MIRISPATAASSFETAERILQQKMKPARLSPAIENKSHNNGRAASVAMILDIRRAPISRSAR
jgi:hypothetical protein